MVELIDDSEIISWVNMDEKWLKYKSEKEWGNSKLVLYFPNLYKNDKLVKQWTTKLGEEIVKNILYRKGLNPRRPKKIKINNIGYCLDWETDNNIWEVKTRNYSTPGTVGEKIFGVVWKYGMLPKYTNKKLYIVLVGYQEYESLYKFGLFDTINEIPEERRKFIDMMKSINMEFIQCSKLLDYQL